MKGGKALQPEITDSLDNVVPSSATIIRATELQSFLNCPRRWFITSHNGLNLEPRGTNLNMRFGTMWHTIMEHYYNPDILPKDRIYSGNAGLKKAIEEHREKLTIELGEWGIDLEHQERLAKDEELLQVLLNGYTHWADNEANPRDSTLVPLSVEQRFLVPILTPQGNKSRAFLAAKYDALVKDNQDHMWVMEHKTRGVSSRVDDPQGMILDMQMGLQLIILKRYMQHAYEEQSRPSVRGVLYNLVRRQKPSSRVRNPIYGRHRVYRSDTDLNILEHTLYNAYREMLTIHDLKDTRYNPQVWAGGFCTWGCPAITVCEALVRGDDYELALDLGFKPRERTIWEMLDDEMGE